MLPNKTDSPPGRPNLPLPPPPPPPVQTQFSYQKPAPPLAPKPKVAEAAPPPQPQVAPKPKVAEAALPPQPQVTPMPKAAEAAPPPQPQVTPMPKVAEPVPPPPPAGLTQPLLPAAIQPLLPPPPMPSQSELPPVAERKIREYRYRTRILKASILPIFFSIMSFWMLYNYVNGFEPFFTYELNYILAGFLIGFIVIAGFVLANMRMARRDGSYAARQKYGILIILAFLVPYVYLILFIDPARAWRFSIGFFASAIITPIMVMAYEAFSDGKFYVQEEEVDDRLTRTLVFRH